MRFLKSFGRFWYDFIVGDDWKISVAVVLALAVLLGALLLRPFGDAGLTLLGGAAVVIAFSVSLLLDVRGKKELAPARERDPSRAGSDPVGAPRLQSGGPQPDSPTVF
jgi:hypothetical protein